MILPKTNKVQYRSDRHIKKKHHSKIIKDMQLMCYEGYYSMCCANCKISKSCWFRGLKGV